MPEIILPHGNYQRLESYQNCMVIFDATYDFCSIFLKQGDRTIDQMVQAARSGKQNIAEGCVDSKISMETEIKLIGVARGSLTELLNDYQDYIRIHNLSLWGKDDERILKIRQFTREKDKTYKTYKTYFNLSEKAPELFCNLLITLIHQTNYLLDCQLRTLERKFVENGGIRERMSKARLEHRNKDGEEVLSLLREIYREIAIMGRPDLLKKLERIATIIKGETQQ